MLVYAYINVCIYSMCARGWVCNVHVRGILTYINVCTYMYICVHMGGWVCLYACVLAIYTVTCQVVL